MPGYDAWLSDEPVCGLELEAERAAYAAEQAADQRPLHYRVEWFYDWILNRIVVRFEKESRRGWSTLNESVGETLADALRHLREQRRAARGVA